MQPRPRTPGKPRLEGLIRVLAIVTAVAIVGAAGVGVWKLSRGATESVELPAFVHDALAPPGAPKAYQGAIDHADEFRQIPCYCGCSETEGHESLRDCFIASEQDGAIAFSQHGAG